MTLQCPNPSTATGDGRLAASRLNRFAARSGAPSHCLPPRTRLRTVVAETSILGSGQVWGRPEFAQRIVSFVTADRHGSIYALANGELP